MRLVAAFIGVVALVNAAPRPEQVHIAFHGDHTMMAVHWTTFEYDNAQVKYGISPSNLQFTATDEGVKKWTSGASERYSHKAMMRNLQPSTTYYYQIGTRQFSFKTMAANPQTYKVCIFGDLGYFHGNSTESLLRNGLAGKFDFIVHLGDIAYDLHSKNGSVGDDYMNQLEPLISKVPYMVVAGNHEDDGKNFTDYQERFWMPDNGYDDSQFYSFDIGPIHWVGISAEYYGYYYAYGMGPVLAQYEWLKNDLKLATANRATTPWILTFQHRPFYCSNINSAECQAFENRLIRTGWLDMPGLEPLFLQYGVDMGFWGHEHSYERFYPIADRQYWNETDAYVNPKAPVYVISGSAGCHSAHAWFSDSPWPFSASRSNDYGYAILTVANATHLHLEQISIEKDDTPVDDFWIVKTNANVHSQAMRAQFPGWKFPSTKCHPKNVACRMSLQQLNEEL
uniref:Purple acid phosphatase n=1 Tax=Haemonchus contortus TaxID=6289 RepID=W6NBU1_HAECO